MNRGGINRIQEQAAYDEIMALWSQMVGDAKALLEQIPEVDRIPESSMRARRMVIHAANLRALAIDAETAIRNAYCRYKQARGEVG